MESDNDPQIMTEEEAEAMRTLLRERGYTVSFSPSVGGANVLEYWDAPVISKIPE